MCDIRACNFCGRSTEDRVNLGDIMTIKKIVVHYYCLLLATNAEQNGKDKDGLLGFLHKDIIAELKRSQKKKCVYCKKTGASVFCSSKSCKVVFHLPCGLERGSGHQFYNRFLSTCRNHYNRQKYTIPQTNQCCTVCYEDVNFKEWRKILWAPCCKKSGFFHKSCLQELALSMGYMFRCPICNNANIFQPSMRHHGVYIPHQEASWENDPHAFQELSIRVQKCNASICKCPRGYMHKGKGKWEIINCNDCGSEGIHRSCNEHRQTWVCPDCVKISLKASKTKSNSGNASQGPSSSTERRTPLQSTSSVFNYALPTTSNATSSFVVTDIDEPSCSISIPKAESKKRKLRSNTKLVNYLESKSTLSSTITCAESVCNNSSDVIDVDDSEEELQRIVPEEEPHLKSLITKYGSVIPVKVIKQRENVHGDVQVDTSQTTELGFKITNVRSLSETDASTSSPMQTRKKVKTTCHKPKHQKDCAVLKYGENQTTVKCSNTSNIYTMQKVFYSAMHSAYQINGQRNAQDGVLVNTDDGEYVNMEVEVIKEDNSYNSSSESDVIIIE